MTDIARFEFLLVVVSIILLLALAARKIRLPPSTAFIGGGVALALVPGIPSIDFSPDLVLVLFLPPLLMSSAYFTVWPAFRANIVGIAQLAVGAVIFSTLFVGLVAHWLVPSLPWSVCFALGAIIAPPDAVAAKSILARVRLPESLSALIEGESLLNDASSLVIYRVAIASFLSGTFSVGHAALSFVGLAVGGVALGAVAGWGLILALRVVRDATVTICLTLLGPWLAYILGDRLGVSGVMSTVTMGLLFGWHQHTIFTPDIRIRAEAFWSIITFLLESMIFVLIGLSLRMVFSGRHALETDGGYLFVCIAGVVIAAVVARFVWVYGGFVFALLWRRRKGGALAVRPAWANAFVLSWAGMRGVVSLAVALSTPENLPGRDFILLTTFCVILFTVIGQGTTLGPLIRLTGLSARQSKERPHLLGHQARLMVATAQRVAAERLAIEPDGTIRHPRLVEQYRFREAAGQRFVLNPDQLHADRQAHYQAVLTIIQAGRAEILRMHRHGQIHDDILRQLEYELDLQEITAQTQSGA